MDTLLTVVAFLLIIGVLIVAHEFGHFWVARRNGIKVEEFGFGLPLVPRIFAVKRGDTTYSIYPLPIGGFVKMLGEDGGGKQSKRSFASKSPGVRARVLIAGVAMNALLAFLLLTVGFLFKMPPIALCADDIPGSSFRNDVTVAAVSEGGPAAQAGIRSGDVVQRIDGQDVRCQIEVPALLSARAGEPTVVAVARGDEVRTLTVTPEADGVSAGKVGIAPTDNYQSLDYPWWVAPWAALKEIVAITILTLGAIGGVFAGIFTQGSVPAGVAGPVGIAKLTGEVLDLGALVLLRFVAIISLSLAIFNLLPIPALDGGRLVFVGIEKLRRGKPVSPRIEHLVHAAGFAFLIGLILFITYFDIIR